MGKRYACGQVVLRACAHTVCCVCMRVVHTQHVVCTHPCTCPERSVCTRVVHMLCVVRVHVWCICYILQVHVLHAVCCLCTCVMYTPQVVCACMWCIYCMLRVHVCGINTARSVCVCGVHTACCVCVCVDSLCVVCSHVWGVWEFSFLPLLFPSVFLYLATRVIFLKSSRIMSFWSLKLFKNYSLNAYE